MTDVSAAGWYRDPVDPDFDRRWDGTSWTADTRASSAPLPPPAAASPVAAPQTVNSPFVAAPTAPEGTATQAPETPAAPSPVASHSKKRKRAKGILVTFAILFVGMFVLAGIVGGNSSNTAVPTSTDTSAATTQQEASAASDPDAAYLSDISGEDPSLVGRADADLIKWGRAICSDMNLTGQKFEQETSGAAQSSGVTLQQAAIIVRSAVVNYCPEVDF